MRLTVSQFGQTKCRLSAIGNDWGLGDLISRPRSSFRIGVVPQTYAVIPADQAARDARHVLSLKAAHLPLKRTRACAIRARRRSRSCQRARALKVARRRLVLQRTDQSGHDAQSDLSTLKELQ